MILLSKKRLILLILFAFMLEVFVFNFQYVKKYFCNKPVLEKSYGLNDITKINWHKEKSGALISDMDPMLVIEDVDGYVENLSINMNINPRPKYIQVFYTDKEFEQFNGEKLITISSINSNTVKYDIKKYIKSIRIDLGDYADTKLEDIQIKFTDVQFDFNLARVIAVILIYVIAIKLFEFQKGELYKI